MIRKLCIGGLGVVLFGLFCNPLLAADQKYPSKPIRLVVPFSAGGALDTMARELTHGMSSRLGEPAVD
jgi:tripartite-type tricarboxylate transporter receptor subunit TctC